jgi:hypothetical protein
VRDGHVVCGPLKGWRSWVVPDGLLSGAGRVAARCPQEWCPQQRCPEQRLSDHVASLRRGPDARDRELATRVPGRPAGSRALSRVFLGGQQVWVISNGSLVVDPSGPVTSMVSITGVFVGTPESLPWNVLLLVLAKPVEPLALESSAAHLAVALEEVP